MVQGIKQLDLEVAALKTNRFSDSTQRTYAASVRAYFSFCSQHHLPPLPATTVNITRYIAFLARSKAYSTIQQYLSILNILHLELGFPHPTQDNYPISSLMKAVRRAKATPASYKLPLSLDQLGAVYNLLDRDNISHAQLWAIIVCCFYGLLRISNVTVPCESQWDPNKTLLRSDVSFGPQGCVLKLRWSKTIQFHQRVLEIPLPLLSGKVTCPVAALVHFFSKAGPMPDTVPAFAFRSPTGQLNVPTPANIRGRLAKLWLRLGLRSADFNTHSLRRSGASFLLSQGVPLEAIKTLGDWRSDCVFSYLKPNISQKFTLAKKGFTTTD